MLEIDLLKGEFNPDDLKEVLMELLVSKINFHNKKSLSSKIIKGDEDYYCNERVQELRLDIEKVKELVSSTIEQNKKLKVTGKIKIEIIE